MYEETHYNKDQEIIYEKTIHEHLGHNHLLIMNLTVIQNKNKKKDQQYS